MNSPVKRAFFSTLLYIYLLDPLLFIRGGSLFDSVWIILIISIVACLSCDYFLICIIDNYLEGNWMGKLE